MRLVNAIPSKALGQSVPQWPTVVVSRANPSAAVRALTAYFNRMRRAAHRSHRSLSTLVIILALAAYAAAQATVVLLPVPKLQFFDLTGNPLAFGCVFTYNSQTSTPLATYTDFTGNTLNPNPLILSGGGFGSIWIQTGTAYTVRVKAAGGTQCSSGNTISSTDGIIGGTSQTTTIIPYSPTPIFPVTAQNQFFTLTLTGNAVSLPLSVTGVIPPSFIEFQITQDAVGGHTFTWPTNVIGGATIGGAANQVTTQLFLWNGVNATALGPAITGAGPSIVAGPIAGTLFTGTSLNLNGTGLLATTAQSGTGSLCMTTGCNLTTPAINAPTVQNGGFTSPTLTSPVINAVSITGTVVQTACSDGTTASVNANTTSAQVVKTCFLNNGTINAQGKSFRITISMNMVPNSSYVHTVLFGAGASAFLVQQSSLETFTVASASNSTFTLTCTTTTAGVSGILRCSGAAGVSGPTAAYTSQDFTTGAFDLTGPVYVGVLCQFGTASTSNVCTSNQIVVEQLN